MSTLTVTTKDQVTFRKDLLRQLGISPGDKIEVEKMPDGRVSLHAARPTGKISDLYGLLSDKTDKVATLDDINEAIEAGWAGER